MQFTRAGANPSRSAPSDNFTGRVRVDLAFETEEPGRSKGSYVTFEPGARTNWHTHPLGQTLIITAGRGHVQAWGEPVEIVRAGDVICFRPGEKHWHGASPDTAMTHLAIVEALGGQTATWLEPVTEEQYTA